MKKLMQYIKPYFGYVIAVVVLLFCQSVVDLNLPNLMSDIVNVGIQQGGIAELAPRAIPARSLDRLTAFMTEEDRALVRASYVPADPQSLSAEQWEAFLRDWPGAAEQPVLRQERQPGTDARLLELAFARGDYALRQCLQEAGGHGVPSGELDALLKDLSPEQRQRAIDAAQTVPESMLEQVGPVLTKAFYQQLRADLGAIQSRYIVKVGSKMLLATLFLAAFAISVGFCTSKLGTGVARDLRRDLFAHVTTFTSNEFDRFGTASLITRCTNDVVQIRGLLSMGLRAMCYAPIMGIGGIIMALYKSPDMAWIIALAGIIILGIMTVLFTVAVPRFKIMQKLVDRLNLVSRENLSGMMVIRAFATQSFEEKRFDRANRDLSDNNLFVFRAMAMMMPMMMLVMNGVSLLIVWFGGHQIAASSMQVGDMMAFIQYTIQIIMSFLMISMVFVMVPRAVVSANRIEEVLDCRSSIEDDPHPEHLPRLVQGVVAFHDVSFRYEGADENVLEHISFTARPGETTALIGSTGSGKSTLVNLIPRFFDVTSGSITLDGVDIRKLPQQELRSAIGYVPQKGILFSGDIASNLKYGDGEATEAQLREAVETAQAAEFIDQLPEGFSTPISQGGSNVSGGQRQRLSIARALVKDAPVYIFDDTFSALDFKTDAKLRQALRTKVQHATTLIVAQRVSTIMRAEQIVVLEEGRIVGIGTHEELMKQCSTYREIAESQLSKEELA